MDDKPKVLIKVVKATSNYTVPPDITPMFDLVPNITYSNTPTVADVFSWQYVECCKCRSSIGGNDLYYLISVVKNEGWQFDELMQGMVCPECLEKEVRSA